MSHERFEREDGYVVSSDRALLDRPMILDFLKASYWAKHRDPDSIWRGIEGSTPYGLYATDGGQVGFARIISDGERLGWIGDLFVLEAHRGRGLGKWLMEILINQSRFKRITNWQLSTEDAQGLYEPFGFKVFEGQGKFMTMEREALT